MRRLRSVISWEAFAISWRTWSSSDITEPRSPGAGTVGSPAAYAGWAVAKRARHSSATRSKAWPA